VRRRVSHAPRPVPPPAAAPGPSLPLAPSTAIRRSRRRRARYPPTHATLCPQCRRKRRLARRARQHSLEAPPGRTPPWRRVARLPSATITARRRLAVVAAARTLRRTVSGGPRALPPARTARSRWRSASAPPVDAVGSATRLAVGRSRPPHSPATALFFGGASRRVASAGGRLPARRLDAGTLPTLFP